MPEETTTLGTASLEYGDLYLKFIDEEQSIAALEGYEGSIDVIGIIADIDNTNPENPIILPLEGWHVNIRLAAGEDDSVLEAFKIQPRNPMRVWA